MGTPGLAADTRPDDVEVEIARGMARHAVVLGPLLVLAGGLWRGVDGAASAGLGLVLVMVNVTAAAFLARRAAAISPSALYVAALGGYVLRLGVLTVIVLLLRDVVDAPAFGASIVTSQLALLTWEVRSVLLVPQARKAVA